MGIGIGIGIPSGSLNSNRISPLVKAYIKRVKADGGTVEAIRCLKTAFPFIPTSSAIKAILTPLKARSTYYENEVVTIKTLQSLENCKS